ncbi:hypothetical protein BDW59DRAFT_175703 [Aspergillus cavernicola]|uniref:t-SNARE coiled-coil homology domain-containing protein n=1 Tax=Aspergillus cavernicola TaxID=176166 RepID=A0ABR4HMS1_9EURO
MPQKRNHPSSGSGSSPYAKRARPSYAEDEQDDESTQNTVTPYERPRNHPVFGQKGAFPGLDTDAGDELFYGPADDGLEYLRMVRSEANSLPTLFTAPAATEPPAKPAEVPGDTEQAQDGPRQEVKIEEPGPVKRLPEGVFSDGVYIGLTTTKPIADEGFSDAQASYYNLLHHRFRLLRSILKCTPPSEAISALDDSHPISFPRWSKNAQKEWRRLLLKVNPQTVQLACMDLDTVLGVLVIVARLMSENVRSGDTILVRRIGAWAWGLLGRCRDSGQMGAQEIGDIRELGKRAVRILQKMGEVKKDVQGDEEDDGYESEADHVNNEDGRLEEQGDGHGDSMAISDPDKPEKRTDAEALERAKARLEAQVSAAGDELTSQETGEEEGEIVDEGNGVDVEIQIRAMLDMIITIVGEHYGQRDLLEAREIWTARYSDFTTFHTTLISQTNSPPPLPLPPKSWFSNTVSNADLRESRRQGLESYLRVINEAEDSRWRSSPAWRAFLNLPSLGNSNANANNENSNISASSARLHAAVMGPGAGGGSGEAMTDPTLWLDCYRDLKSHLHDARLHLTRRDQETTPQRQHESSARAKSSLVRVGTLTTALENGLKGLAARNNSNGNGASRHGGDSAFGALGEGEIRRRKDLLTNARKEKDGLEDLLNAMAAKSRVDNAVASIKDKEALVGSAGGRKPTARSGRVLGKETERTRELDNQGLLQLQRETMQDQDMDVQELMKIVHRQKELGIRINEELEVQNEMLRLVDEDSSRLEQKVDVGKKRLGKIS